MSLSRFLADLLFPIECLGCGRTGEYLCAPCLARIPRWTMRQCPICKRDSLRGRTCLACADKTPLEGIFAGAHYQDDLIRRTIHAYKYRFVEDLAEPLAELLRQEIHNAELPLPYAIIPVPLHVRRLRWRNFNQAELLTRVLSNTLAPQCSLTVIADALVRTRATLPQAKTRSREERLANLHNAFVWQPERPADSSREFDIRGKSVWLVDDVATTSATLEECARVLKDAGALEVTGIVVAH